MLNVNRITSFQNQRIKEVIRLRECRERKKTGLFLIEGYREIKRALDSGHPLHTLFYCPELFLGSNEEEIIQKSSAELWHCTPSIFSKISYRDRPDGLLAIAPQLCLGLNSLTLSKVPFLVFAERIEKPGNLGSILRSCDATGVDAIFVCDPTTDIHNPNVVRSSVGTLFTRPVLELEAQEALEFLAKQNISLIATTPHASLEYTQADYTGPVAIAVGAEQYGLSPFWMEHAALQVRIPMLGAADSLNVASATTLLLYEVLRQRIPK